MEEARTFEQLADQADELRTRINRFRTALGRFFVAKQEPIDLMVVAAVAQEPILLVGPPGTAKLAFVPVTVSPTMAMIEVRCPSGHVVTLPNADRDTLRHLFAALTEEPAC